MSAFTDLIGSARAERKYLAVLEPYDPDTDAVVTLYYSDSGFTSEPDDTPPNQPYVAVLDTALQFERSMFQSGLISGQSIPGYGSLELKNSDGRLDALAGYSWRNRRVRVYLGGKGFALTDYGLIFDGVAEKIEYSDQSIIVRLRDLKYKLDVELQDTLFAGSGDAEGSTDLTNQPKPKCFGLRRNIEPVYLGVSGSGYHQYAVHDGAIVGILAVRDLGVALEFTTSSTPIAGQYTYDIATGIITLGGAAGAFGKFTADVIGDRYLSTTSSSSVAIGTGTKSFTVSAGLAIAAGMRMRAARTSALTSTWMDGTVTSYSGTTLQIGVASGDIGGSGTFTDWTIMAHGTVAGIVKRIASLRGLSTFDAGSFSALDTDQPATVGLYVSQGGNTLTILDELVNGASCYYGFTRAAAFQIGRLDEPGTSVETYDTRHIFDIVRLPTEDPSHQTSVRYKRNHTVLTGNDIAGVVTGADRDFLTQEWRGASTADDTDVSTAYLLSQILTVDSGFDDATDAADEADRLQDLFGVRRDMFRVTVKTQPLQRDINQTITIRYNNPARYDLSAGRDFVITSISEDLKANEVTLEVWG